MRKLAIFFAGLMVLFSVYAFESTYDKENSTFDVRVYKGWNLVSGGLIDELPILDNAIVSNDCDALYGFRYFPIEKTYERFTVENGLRVIDKGSDFQSSLEVRYLNDGSNYAFMGLHNGVWIYSKKTCSFKLKLFEPRTYNTFHGKGQKLVKGWNFIGATPAWLEKHLIDLSNCEITSLYEYLDKSELGLPGEWIKNPYIDSMVFSKTAIGKGYLIKVANDCEFIDLEAIPVPPVVPE
jgi:hypothetical protein